MGIFLLEPIDFNPNSGCLFCISRQEHSVKIGSSKSTCKTSIKQETTDENRRLSNHDPSTGDPVNAILRDEPLDLSLKHALSNEHILPTTATNDKWVDKHTSLDFKSDIKKLCSQEELDRALTCILSEKIDYSRPLQSSKSFSNKRVIETLFNNLYTLSDDPLLPFLSPTSLTTAFSTASSLSGIESSKNGEANSFYPPHLNKNNGNLNPSITKLAKKMASERLTQEVDFLRSNSQSSCLNETPPYTPLSSSSLSITPSTIKASASCSALSTSPKKNRSSNRYSHSNLSENEKISSLLNGVMNHVLQEMFEQSKQNVSVENLKYKSTKFRKDEPLFIKKKIDITTTTPSSASQITMKKPVNGGKLSNGNYDHSQSILNNLLRSKLDGKPNSTNNSSRKISLPTKSKRSLNELQQQPIVKRVKLQDDNRTIYDRQSPTSSSSSSCSSQSPSFKSTKSRSSNSLNARSKIIIGNDGRQIRPKRGQYRRYESGQLAKAVAAVLSNEMSVHKAGSYFGVPHSTLEYKVKERNSKTKNKITEDTPVIDCSMTDSPTVVQSTSEEQKSPPSNLVSSSFGNNGIIPSHLSKLCSDTMSQQKSSSTIRSVSTSNDVFQDQQSPSPLEPSTIIPDLVLSDYTFLPTKLKHLSNNSSNESLEQTSINDKNNNETKITAETNNIQS
ncbi:unnamed protein product [Didymodactylos carnosus]|uniref:HTH psq-type domain-containing protein n=1 Tax=Didymodactylos carnosus TaxID=1234261 RepID=A0A815F878_9BILA|nr:unnamed protein product [Didymodactylos carnosus]CAF1325610.1 unnamed protein product [Didymodactylos carnosus]CAF3707131.1 unnamed protein product [Didymodactylos carnosus]CAF4175049.1 unnamed protein product [Didymodactylos carnosus]